MNFDVLEKWAKSGSIMVWLGIAALANAAEGGQQPHPTGPSSMSAAHIETASPSEVPGNVAKTISYALLEDYNKGEDLSQVALDFQLMNSLGVHTWRGSFGWDDYEPEKGIYDFTWLHQFAALAEQYGITLRPYVAYTAPWAADGGNSSDYWSYPPADMRDWYDFMYNLSKAMSIHPNIVSYEIYNEVDSTQWWNGDIPRYNTLLRQAADAVQAGNPKAQVIMAGMVLSGYCPMASSVDGWKISRKKKQMMTRRIRRRAASVMSFATASLNSFSTKRAVCAI